MNITNLSETDLRYHTTDKSFQRGETYYRQGAVIDLCQRGKCLCGEVAGNNIEPYQVNIQFDDGVTEAIDLQINLEEWQAPSCRSQGLAKIELR